jgi:hypothetical protein
MRESLNGPQEPIRSMPKRWLLRFMVGGIPAIAVSCVCYLHIFGGYTLLRLPSPDGEAIAEINVSAPGGQGGGGYTGVMLRGRWNPFRETVFGGLNSGARISIQWASAKTLLISCQDCAKLSGSDMRPTQWRDLQIQYDTQTRALPISRALP